MAKDYSSTVGDVARILAELEKACKKQGLPWDPIFGSLGDEESKLRKAALAAWGAILFDRTTLVSYGSVCYQACHPNIPMSFQQAALWCERNEEEALSFLQIAQIPELRDEIHRAYGDNCRVADITFLQKDKFHIATVADMMATRHIRTDENFGPNDVIILRLDPPGCALNPDFRGSANLPIFPVVTDVTMEQVHRHLRRCGCSLASDTEFLESPYSLEQDERVFVRGNLMFCPYSVYDGEKALQGTIGSDSAIIRAGGYVIGKRIPGETRLTP
jgi:hypothetical protein